MNRLSFVLLLTLGATACDDDVPPPKFDGGSQRDGQVTTDGGGDGSSLSDAKADLPGADGLVADLTFGDGGCVIGTVDNCTDCGDKCAPPTTNAASAQVVCIGSCAIACQGEFYDVNGKLDDGCEVEDTTIQASENNAKDLGSVPDWNAKVAFSGTLLSDDRTRLISFAAPNRPARLLQAPCDRQDPWQYASRGQPVTCCVAGFCPGGGQHEVHLRSESAEPIGALYANGDQSRHDQDRREDRL